MEIALEAFPNTSWAFVYRQPVQTMMSHLDPAKGGGTGAPCLRSMRSPPQEVAETISRVVGMKNPPKEAWCAAHLNMLCNSALRAYSKYGTRPGSAGEGPQQRGFLVNYESLPGVVPLVLLPLFGVQPTAEWLEKMKSESGFYSKGREKERIFKGDSQDKDERATQAIQKYAKEILLTTFDKLTEASIDALQRFSPTSLAKVSTSEAEGKNWAPLNVVPLLSDIQRVASSEQRTRGLQGKPSAASPTAAATLLAAPRRGHSTFPETQFLPWNPFSNTHTSKPFEPARCPDVPEQGYPKAYSIMNITSHWNTDDTEIPPFHFDALCHFDYQDPVENKKAWAYRKAEVPFVVYNMPEVDEVVRKWSDVDYLDSKLGKKAYRTETSKDNHFMYWNGGGKFLRGQKWEPPTGLAQVKFEDWLELAVKGQNKSLETREHQYFRVSSDMGNNWLYDELPFFKPKQSLIMVTPSEQRGIHCRFGMRSIIAEAHFDGSRNFCAALGGMRRWILAHPNQCENMHMLSRDHPSSRHSAVDWSKPDIVRFPNFPKVQANEVIMQPGDVLYLPTYWIHYIISLNVNFQCNTRSGRTSHYDKDINRCGF